MDWVAPALEAVERGEPLPAPFDDQAEVWRSTLRASLGDEYQSFLAKVRRLFLDD